MINQKNLIKTLMGLTFLVMSFHLFILFKIIPFNIVWGGQFKSEQEMYVFESISIILNSLLLWVLSLKNQNVKHKFIDITLWFFFIIFFLNTIGNLFAQTNFEKFFSIFTLLFALFLFKILWKKKGKPTKQEKT